MKGLKITYGPTAEEQRKQNECVACAGSGWYDSRDKKGRPIPCGACDGTGQDKR